MRAFLHGKISFYRFNHGCKIHTPHWLYTQLVCANLFLSEQDIPVKEAKQIQEGDHWDKCKVQLPSHGLLLCHSPAGFDGGMDVLGGLHASGLLISIT